MDKEDTVAKSFAEDFDKLTGESNFGDEESNGFLLFKGFGGELEINIGFAAAGNTA